ncbi:Abortive infection bacteriophage resistance protein [Bosea sp. LC85]|uniref:Abi family protein n=1 Tax=Bosea sp. LC85 TaxID=1502851 RepID=UPI0004E2D218|nr:Abi family protein [Bosea sp. LC85]KFC74546.1 Abortive infection bacteriophage resistance protein [Bosea sp. LC85]
MKFTKPSLSISDQIVLLVRRGMAVPDPARAEHFLRHISYYRLRAYWLPFEQPAAADGDHTFRKGTSFEDALQLYMFDRHLRLLVMDAVERIEVSLRGGWAHHLAVTYGPHGYINPQIYGDPANYATALASLIEEIGRSRDTFIIHYGRKYSDPQLPPIWMAAEVMSLGRLSKWIGNLGARADRQAIAKTYGLDEKVLLSIAHHLTVVRNICAHHGRLWNKQFTVTMMVPNSPGSLKLAMNPQTTRKLYNTLATVGYMLQVIAPGSEWRRHLIELLDAYPLAPPAEMGFPANWRVLPAWRLPPA